MYRQLGAVVTVTLTALAVMTTTASASPEVENIAHRGGAAFAPENTIAACAMAQVQGADTCEFDIQQTKDRQLVLIHDQTLGRTTNVEDVFPGRSPWRVSDFTLPEIKRLDAGSWFSPRYRGERVPTLEQALRATGNSRIGLLLEIKHSPGNRDIDRLVADKLEDTRSWWSNKRLAVQAFDWQSMRTFHTLMPSIPIALLGKPSTDRLPELAQYARGINLPHSDLTPEYVDEVHKQGMHIYSGTANRPTVLRRLISYGVDGIMTNRPDHLDAVKREAR
ncbi:glycerophosphodiester phosphodiesterase [Nonomuraea jiangxiensis]|uniref:Glycerophosphoryl diester phosphodiesterase n=1 Tax=Nonomuraea jiangxiensis TaxID=633440 RepID=A0A1G8ENS2_9ACTN|nr:glycerophosphodiester phosphodiesterase family protein [Nonomuraea jiangxiensis]SDH71502.1 glycerophosphoryl diester phosphodiesterase [Nonomuraea jiangxiensis]